MKQTSDGGYIWGGYLQDSSTYNEVGVIGKASNTNNTDQKPFRWLDAEFLFCPPKGCVANCLETFGTVMR